MFDPGSARIWYGCHETPEQSTQVIFDPTLPGMPAGQVYLYNAARDSIVRYDLKTVQHFLKDLGKAEAKQAQASMGKRWRMVRKEYMKTYRAAARSAGRD